MERGEFRNALGEEVFRNKYALYPGETWAERAKAIVNAVCPVPGPLYADEVEFLEKCIREFKFLPGGRYIYYAGRDARFWNNCFLLRAESDTREEWADLAKRATSCLMTGGGIGIDYSRLRPSGQILKRTGGVASGPIPLMKIINEIGRNVMQGGSRRSAIYGSLHHSHDDIEEFLVVKNWSDDVKMLKAKDFSFPADLDMTNISINYDDEYDFDSSYKDSVLYRNVWQACSTGEPGFSFNFFDRKNETLRNACTEVVSEDDSDVCNLGSVNMARIDSIEEFEQVCYVAAKFLIAGSMRSELPYEKVYRVREKNRRIGVGLMGVHEWLLKRGISYKEGRDNSELASWLGVYANATKWGADETCVRNSISFPKGYRAIAPTGSIGILAGTTTGIEPIYAVAYKRRYLTQGTKWVYQYVVDSTAKSIVESGINPDSIESAISLAEDIDARVGFQAFVQRYVDMGISSTVNLPEWGSPGNNPDKVDEVYRIVRKYAHHLRGLTFYPDGSRGGQPITEIHYNEAMKHEGRVFEEVHDVCDITGRGGVCGS